MISILLRIEHGLEWAEEKSKSLFVAAALLLYIGSLVLLAGKVNPVTDINTFLVKALGNLSLPFGIILLQELLELLTTISKSTLHSTCQQFEIVSLVILRSFFKDFYKLNNAVGDGSFSEPVQKALVKLGAIIAITVLIFIFKKLREGASAERRHAAERKANLWKQAGTLALCFVVLFHMIITKNELSIMAFISLVFTGLIVIDSVFFLWSALRNHEFDMLMFEGGLVVSLIFARFPLFTTNILSYILAVVGIGFATVSFRLFVRPVEQEFLGRPSEDSVSRLDFCLNGKNEELPPLMNSLKSFMQICQAPKPCFNHSRLVCEELLTKISSHNKEQDNKNINLSFAIYKKLMTINVSTAGEVYNPFRTDVISNLDKRDSSPASELQTGGMGMHLVRITSERVAFRRESGRNIITVLMSLENRQKDTTHIEE